MKWTDKNNIKCQKQKYKSNINAVVTESRSMWIPARGGGQKKGRENRRRKGLRVMDGFNVTTVGMASHVYTSQNTTCTL